MQQILSSMNMGSTDTPCQCVIVVMIVGRAVWVQVFVQTFAVKAMLVAGREPPMIHQNVQRSQTFGQITTSASSRSCKCRLITLHRTVGHVVKLEVIASGVAVAKLVVERTVP